MTKELLPGLGSGALREALKVGDEVSVLGTVVDEPNVDGLALVKFGPYELDASCSLDKNVIVLPRFALSLSSPIEPAQCQPHCPKCNTGLPDLEYRHEGTVANWAQASSEIRERENGESNLPWLQRQKMDRFIGCGQHGDRYGEDSQVWDLTCERCAHRFDAIVRVLDALAPSRQGAGGK